MLSQRNVNRLGYEDDIQQAAISSWLSNLDPRVLRISISTLSILTTKAIYIHGYHHPLRLVLLHLLATSLWEIILWLSSRKIERIFDAKDYTLYDLTRRGKLWSKTGLKLCLRFGFGIGALFCEYQAIYRFRSLLALAMLLLPDWSLLVRFIRHTNVSVLRKIAASIGCLVGVGMVLVFEYQLSEVGLKLSMIAVSLAVASQLLRQEPSISGEDQFARCSLPFAPVRDKVILLPVAILAAMVAIYMREYLIYTPPLSNILLVILAINTLAAVVTFQLSGSYFRQTEPLATFNGVQEDHGEDEVDPALETISFQSVIALGSVLVDLTIGTSSSVSIWQYIGFWIALSTLMWIGRQFGPCVMENVYHTHVAVPHDYHLPGFDALRGAEKYKMECPLASHICGSLHAPLNVTAASCSTSTQASPRWTPRNE